MQKGGSPLNEIKLAYVGGLLAIILLVAASLLLSGATGLVAGAEVTVGQDQAPPGSLVPQPSPIAPSRCGTTCWLESDGAQPGTFESAQGKIGVLSRDGNCYSAQKYSADQRCCSSLECPASNPVCSNDGRCQ